MNGFAGEPNNLDRKAVITYIQLNLTDRLTAAEEEEAVAAAEEEEAVAAAEDMPVADTSGAEQEAAVQQEADLALGKAELSSTCKYVMCK